MNVRFISTEGDYLEAVVECNGRQFTVMDEFSGSELDGGAVIDVEIFPGLLDEGEEWESMFSGNPDRRKDFESIGGWRYRAYGVVVSVNPVIVDCGVSTIEAPVWTNDESVVDAPIAFTIERLGAAF